MRVADENEDASLNNSSLNKNSKNQLIRQRSTIVQSFKIEVVREMVTTILRIHDITSGSSTLEICQDSNQKNQLAIDSVSESTNEQHACDVELRSSLKVIVPQLFVSFISHCLPNNIGRQEFLLFCLNHI